MSDIDLTEAVDAAARVAWREDGEKSHGQWEAQTRMTRHVMREFITPVVAAAAPLIEAAVREQVAREIEAAEAAARASAITRPVVGPTRTDFANDWQWAARIARGGAR